MPRTTTPAGPAFPSLGVTLSFLVSLRDDPRMSTPMLALLHPNLEHPEALSLARLRGIAARARTHSHLPRRTERARYSDEGKSREFWIRALRQPPTTTAQVRACIVQPDCAKLGGGGGGGAAYALCMLGGSDAVSVRPTDFVCHAWRDRFSNLVDALEAESERHRRRLVRACDRRRRARRRAQRERFEAEKLANGGRRPTSGGIAERLRVLERQNASLLRGERCIAANAQMTSRFSAGFGLSPVRICVPKPKGKTKPPPRGGGRSDDAGKEMGGGNPTQPQRQRPSTAGASRSGGGSRAKTRARPGTAPAARRSVSFAGAGTNKMRGSPGGGSSSSSATASLRRQQQQQHQHHRRRNGAAASPSDVTCSPLRLAPPPGKRVNMDCMWHTVHVGGITTPRLPFAGSGRADDGGAHGASPYLMIKRGFKLDEREIQNIPRGRLNIMLRWAKDAAWAQSPFKAMTQDRQKRAEAHEEDQARQKGRRLEARAKVKKRRERILRQHHELALERARLGQSHGGGGGRHHHHSPSRHASPSSSGHRRDATAAAPAANASPSSSPYLSPSDPNAVLARKREREVLVHGMVHNLDAELNALDRERRGLGRGSDIFGSAAKNTTATSTSNSSPRMLSPMASAGVLEAERAEADADAALLAQVRYYWIDLFAENQNKAFDLKEGGVPHPRPNQHDEESKSSGKASASGGVSRDNYLAMTYPAGVASIRRTVLVLSEGLSTRTTADPLPLQRTWCLWELFSALSSPLGCRLSLAFTPEAQRAFDQDIVRDYNKLMHVTMGAVDVGESEAFLAADEARLKALVKRCCKNGFADVDSVVRRGLRKWLTREARHALEVAMERGGGGSSRVGAGTRGRRDDGADVARKRRGGNNAANNALGRGKSRTTPRHTGNLGAPKKARASSSSAAAAAAAAAAPLLSLHAVQLANQFGLMHLRDGTDADLDAADVLFRRALRDGERGGLAPKLLVRVRSNLAMLLKMQGHLDEAVALCHTCYEATRRHAGEGTSETLRAANNYASTLQALGRVAEAEALYREALTSHQRAENQGADYVDVNVLSTATRLAELLRASGRQDEAAPLSERVFGASHRVLGFVDSSTLVATNTLAGMLRGQGDNAEAARLYKRVLAASRQQLGTRHPLTFLAMYNLADALEADGLLREAERFARLSLEGYARFNLEGDVRDGTQQLGTILRNLGRDMEADRLADRAGYSWFCGKLVKKQKKEEG